MIDYYGDECNWIKLRESRLTARKNHECIECFRIIDPGEQYECVTAHTDYGFERYKTCAHCCAVREWLVKVCGGFLYHAVMDDLLEHADEVVLNPRWLHVAVACMRRKWRNRNGKLYRPMKLPKIPEEALSG
jgi:hypothetical protein